MTRARYLHKVSARQDKLFLRSFERPRLREPSAEAWHHVRYGHRSFLTTQFANSWKCSFTCMLGWNIDLRASVLRTASVMQNCTVQYSTVDCISSSTNFEQIINLCEAHGWRNRCKRHCYEETPFYFPTQDALIEWRVSFPENPSFPQTKNAYWMPDMCKRRRIIFLPVLYCTDPCFIKSRSINSSMAHFFPNDYWRSCTEPLLY